MGVSTKHRLYGELKRKRHLYLTDTAHKHLVDLAHGNDSSPSEVCEQIIRVHAMSLRVPSSR